MLLAATSAMQAIRYSTLVRLNSFALVSQLNHCLVLILSAKHNYVWTR